MLEIVTFSLLNGVVYGLLLFMVSSGLTLIFSLMGVLNFAHASMFMLGAYFSWQIGKWIGFWPALVVAIVLSAIALFGVGAGYLAIGTMTSALTQSQLTAAMLSSISRLERSTCTMRGTKPSSSASS